MTLPSDEEVQRRGDQFGKAWYAEFAGRGGQIVPPPPQVLVFLGRLLDPAQVLDQFWWPGESIDHETVDGRVVMLTEAAVVDVKFRGVPVAFYPGNPPPGEVECLTFRRSEVASVSWRVPRLVRPSGSLEPGELQVSARDVGWTIDLPTARMYRDGEGYPARVFAAFGLQP